MTSGNQQQSMPLHCNAEVSSASHYKVFVSHPERQHSHELATALHNSGRLGVYIHGAPLTRQAMHAIPQHLRSRIGYCRWGRRVLRDLLPARTVLQAYYRMIWSFDALVARRLRTAGCEAVVAYENAALNEFREAKKLGMACILDNSGVHHALQDRMLAYAETPAFHRRIVERKEEELALADIILVCSNFAAQSFISGGVSPTKLKVVPLGCDTSAFSPQAPTDRAQDAPVRFLFVGRLSRLKGADLVLEAARGLRDSGVPFTLTVVAPLAEAEGQLAGQLGEIACLIDKVPYEELAKVHANADCFILPSRFDSFAFVVAEALASGLPVIVSDHVGAKDMVCEGENGWVVPSGDSDALQQRMLWCARNAAALRAMGAAARATAETWNWARYRSTVLSTFDQFMHGRSWQPATLDGSLHAAPVNKADGVFGNVAGGRISHSERRG